MQLEINAKSHVVNQYTYNGEFISVVGFINVTLSALIVSMLSIMNDNLSGLDNLVLDCLD